MDKIGQQIRALREKRGLVQADLATQVGVREVSVSRWERGIELPSTKYLEALARALGCTILIGGEDGVRLVDADGRGAERRSPALKPMRDAVARVQALGVLALAEFVDDVVGLAENVVRHYAA